ncbi:type II secretion system F family protein [Shimia biformata]|uniref:type II secretion system F family protein n=1 Tax=Shimia biformata TaxID=1294299 RepID=UPI001952377C|nr:type II secretion system F family protein [Shimia biformata]
MLDAIQSYVGQFNVQSNHLILLGVAVGVFLIFWSASSTSIGRANTIGRRMTAITGDRRQARLDRALLRHPTNAKGILKPFVPIDGKSRSDLETKLSHAGFTSDKALAGYTMVRIVLGIALPAIFLAIVAAAKTPDVALPFGLVDTFGTFTNLQTFQILSILIAVGYFGPSYWLNNRVADRMRRIEEGFPNALDLMRISVEAGQGFDAAMTRVGNELAEVSPEISHEFLAVQHQIQAGRDRHMALQDLADRTGVETVRSFANVVKQSLQLGTSMSNALATYAIELRNYRELRAQEMANKLPVKMSAVLASLMLPALVLITLGPVVIRYIRMF